MTTANRDIVRGASFLCSWLIALALGCDIPSPRLGYAATEAALDAKVSSGLAAYWKLNGGGTELVTGNNLSMIGNVTFPSGQLGSAADIDGTTTSYLQAPAQATYNVTVSGFTVEYWIKVRSLPGDNPRTIQALNLDHSQGWESYICQSNCALGRVAFSINSGVPQLLSASSIFDGLWHHVAATYDGNDMKLYIDGTLEATSNQPSLTSTVAGGTLVLGANPPADQFDGWMDEVRIWSVARTAAQIQASMNTELLFGLAGYWKLNGTGTELVTGNNLSMIGNVTFAAGQLGSAADINGASRSYLQAPAQATYNVTAGGFTVEYWIKVRSLPGDNPRTIQALNADRSQGWESYICQLDCAAGLVAFTINSGIPQLLSTTAIGDGLWHHVAATYDGNDMKLYIDGTLEATSNQPGLTSTVSGGTLTLGDNPISGNPDQFDGWMDEVRIWLMARTATDIVAAMNTELPEYQYPTSVEETAVPGIEPYLAQNHPNPFNPSTVIEYNLPEESSVRLSIYDLSGRLVAPLIEGLRPAGPHQVSWFGRDRRGLLAASGVYFYRLEAGAFFRTRRMVLLK